jgi:hypothetical protein
MWEPRNLTTLWVFTACYRDSFTFTFTRLIQREITGKYAIKIDKARTFMELA